MIDHKIIGILGGMGSYATLLYFNNVLLTWDANKDWDYTHLIIDNNTKIPSRTRVGLVL
jgi:aspartate racemase